MFWSNNIFLFEDQRALAQTLRSMGQTASRRIESIAVGLRLDNDSRGNWRVLSKALAFLASRARQGSFRKLYLDIDRHELETLFIWRTSNAYSDGNMYDDLLEMLRQPSTERSFERIIRARTYSRDTRSNCMVMMRDIFKEVHLAFGGKMFCDGALEWEDYKHVKGGDDASRNPWSMAKQVTYSWN